MKNIIEAIPLKYFYGSGDWAYAHLEAHDDFHTYLITADIELIRDDYTSIDTLEYIREYDEWENDNLWIKEYMLKHIEDIETILK